MEKNKKEFMKSIIDFYEFVKPIIPGTKQEREELSKWVFREHNKKMKIKRIVELFRDMIENCMKKKKS